MSEKKQKGNKKSQYRAVLKDSPTFKLVKKLCKEGIVNQDFLKKFKKRFGGMKNFINSKPLREPDDEEYWTTIRDMFAYDENDDDVIPMNTANFAPSFADVQNNMNDFNLQLNKNISIQNRVDELSLVIDDAQVLIATQLGVTKDEIALMRNGSEANNNVNNGTILQETDEVIIWEQNHGTNGQAWKIRQQQRPFVIIEIPSDFGGATTDADIVNEFVKRLTANTKFVTFSHLSNISGRLLPAEDICKAVHARFPSCHVHVDGAMTWGCMDLNLAQMDCDSYSASAHKWFCGPKETGIFYTKKALIPNFVPNTIGYDAKIIFHNELPLDSRRFQLLGQRADPSLMCLLETAEIMQTIGFQAIQNRVLYLGNLVYNGFQTLNLPMTTPSVESQRLGVIIAGVENNWGVALYNHLYEEHNVAVASTGGIRVSAHIYNTAEQIQDLLAAISAYIATNPPPTQPI